MTEVCEILDYLDGISIHMPHTWHDVAAETKHCAPIDFNPHATYVA